MDMSVWWLKEKVRVKLETRMKKNIFVCSILTVVVFCVKPLLAEEVQPTPPDNEYSMRDAGMGGPEREGGSDRREMRKGGMGGGMMHNKPSLVATSDGGIVVLDGHRLLKYDAQLNLINEAELKPGKRSSWQSAKADERKAEPVAEIPNIDIPAVEPVAQAVAETGNDSVEPLPS